MLSVRSAGIPLDTIGVVTDLKVTANLQGTLTIDFSMALPRGFRHYALQQGALVQVCAGPLVIDAGVMAEPDRDNGTFTADGLSRIAERFLTADAANLDAAIDAALSRGLGSYWSRPTSLSATGAVPAYVPLSRALDEHVARNKSMRWRVAPDGRLQTYLYDTTPTLALSPTTPAMQTADDNYASRLFVGHASGVTQVADAGSAERHGAREEYVDLSSLSLINAEEVAGAILADGKARPAYTEGLEVFAGQLTNLGGAAPEPWQVRPGQMIQHFGTLDNDGAPSLGSFNWVLGSVTYGATGYPCVLQPKDRVARTQAEVIAEQVGRLAELEEATP